MRTKFLSLLTLGFIVLIAAKGWTLTDIGFQSEHWPLPSYQTLYDKDPVSNPQSRGNCGICHVDPRGGGPTTDFGLAFVASGRQITDDLRKKFPELFIMAGPSPEPTPANPWLAAFTNHTSYSPGKTVLLSVKTLPGTINNTVDFYAGFILPDGSVVFAPDWGPTPKPFKSKWTVTDKLESILRLTLPPWSPPAGIPITSIPVTWAAAFFQPATFNLIGDISLQKITLVPDLNLIAIHDSSSSQFNKDCMSCHGDMLSRGSLNQRFKGAHGTMMELSILRSMTNETSVGNNTCIHCHKEKIVIDPDKSPGHANLRRNVAVAICDQCHGPAGPGKQFYMK